MSWRVIRGTYEVGKLNPSLNLFSSRRCQWDSPNTKSRRLLKTALSAVVHNGLLQPGQD